MPKFVADGNLTPDFYAVNTMQPPYQPSGNKPAAGRRPALCRSDAATTLPPQTEPTIGDLLSAKGVSWAWYGGAWQAALDGTATTTPVAELPVPPPAVQLLRQLRAGHRGARRASAATAGSPASSSSRRSTRASCRRSRSTSRRAISTSIRAMPTCIAGDAHIADVVAHLEKSPQWPHMLVVVTYDENGGFWDHVAPPKGDRWGPGTRIPAIIVSPFAKRASSTTRSTTRPRSCASSRSASICRCSPG